MTNKYEKPTAWFSYDLWVYCPFCEESFDLLDGHDDDAAISSPLLNNRWGDLEGFECCCPNCDTEFQIEGVEY